MNSTSLTALFKKKYSSEDWKILLSSIFKGRSFYQIPIEKIDTSLNKHADVASICEFGDIKLADNSRILFYEIELKDGKSVTRNRVGLRNLIHSDVIPGDVDGILATYFNPKAKDWRLTFISKSLYWDEEMNEIKSETHPKRYTYVLGENESIKTAVKQFEWLITQIRSREVEINDLIKLFSVEKISKEFFDGYRHHFTSFEDFITDNKEAFGFFKRFVHSDKSTEDQQKETERLVRNFVKKMLGRIVFIYFLQKKGWLGVPVSKPWGDGERDFLSNLFHEFSDPDNFYGGCLVPLFFDTLNSKRDGDIFTLTQSKIPYLNGGLFDKDKVEPLNLKFNPRLFADLFAFFDQYNFTIDENSPDDFDIGVDPEMLGLIFENLLEDNKDKGTFYTPKEVVHFMCKESLALHAAGQLKAKIAENDLNHIEAFIRQNDIYDVEVIRKHTNTLQSVFTSVKICDPAIGSGAFPMGMVYEILRLKKELFGLSNRTNFNYRMEKLDIIRNSVYGVDLDKGAVDIARLRFWLSLIVDEEEPAPLPNLDYKIMQGDSLKEYFEDIRLDDISIITKPVSFAGEQMVMDGPGFYKVQREIEFTEDEKIQLKKWADDFFNEPDRNKKDEIHKTIDRKVLSHIENNVEKAKATVGTLKSKLEQKYHNSGKDLSQQTSGKDFNTWQKYSNQITEFDRKKEVIISIQENTERPWFLWNLFFGDVLQDGNKGFDIVIGNPPYGVKVDDELQDAYGLGSKDSYGAFMSMALKKLVKPDGILCYIVSDTWLTIKSHFELREQILTYQLKKIIRLHQDCFKATVNSCIFTLQKTKSEASDNSIIAADLTNISTRKEIPEFRDKLFHLELYKGDYTANYAVYYYNQNLLSSYSNKPVIVGSPKLFQHLNDSVVCKENCSLNFTMSEINRKSIIKYRLADDYVKKNTSKLWKDDGLVKIISGIKTGNNKKYLRLIDNSTRKKLGSISSNIVNSIADFSSITDNIKRNGFPSKTSYYIEFEMGQPTEQEDVILPCYYQQKSVYAIDWSESSVASMKNEKHSDLANFEFRLINLDACISFSTTGIYAPTFRISVAPIFVNKSSRIIISSNISKYYLLGILNSKLFRYLFNNFVNHTVESEIDDFKRVYIPLVSNLVQIENLVQKLISNQSQKVNYNYFENEQKEIDKLVYELYGLNEEDINEVETWFARRYPKLAQYAYYKPHAEILAAANPQPGAARIKSLIAAGENKKVEFKSSLRYDLREKKPMPHIEHSCFKNLAAFLNTEGGTLLIGVEDNGNILGLEDADYITFKGANKKDELLKHFDNLVEKYFSNSLSEHLKATVELIDGKSVAIIEVPGKASVPVILKNKEKCSEEFFIRRNASTVSLTMFEFFTYAKNHWGTNQ